MSLKTVAIQSPGDMGHSVGQALHEHGLRVITCLEGRSERTRQLAVEAGIEAVATYHDLVREAEIILAILVPARAMDLAQTIAQAIRETGASPVYTDCNAIAPQTVSVIGELITAAGGRFVDAGIIGGPPRGGEATRFYVSGPQAEELVALNDYGLKVVSLGGEIGQASALKMCYAASTKGFIALATELLTAARALGVWEPLVEEFHASQAAAYQRMERQVPGMLPKAYRWVGEMEEIAQTFAHVGLSGSTFEGAAAIYRLVADTPLGQRKPEDPTPAPALAEIVATLAAQLASR